MLSPTSIFRRIPLALPLAHRRLFGGLAYAYDGAELSFGRLREAARSYRLPDAHDYDLAGWIPASRLSIIADAWTFVDHVNRARKLAGRLPMADPPPPEVAIFIAASKPANAIRNRLHHLDEDIFKGENLTEGHPVLGAVSWADARGDGGHVRYSIASGPSIDAGLIGKMQLTDVDGAGDVVDFRLMAGDRTAQLDELRNALVDFMGALEETVARRVRSSLRSAATEQGVSLERAGVHGIADMTMAVRMNAKPQGGGWTTRLEEDGFGRSEVPPGVIDLTDEA